jgi:hypothetical protein
MQTRNYQKILDQFAALRQTALNRFSAQIAANPQLAETLTSAIDNLENTALEAAAKLPPTADAGLAELIGLGPNAASQFGATNVPVQVDVYDETVDRDRITAMADLYYIYQHEKLGVFRALQKLQQLFEAGAVRLSSGDGAYRLYQFDRRGVLRFTKRDRLAAYCRAFGYCAAPPPAGSRPNREFHHLFSHFIGEVAIFWRDKRISEVMRDRANDPTFGSIATVRRAGLDLRNNLKFVSYGHLNVLRVEVMQLLDEAFRILGAADIRNLFGATNAWDVIEEILTRYFGQHVETSARQRLAVAGREILQWLAQPPILQTSRVQFEGLLLQIAEYCEEWLTSAESLGVADPRPRAARVVPWEPRVVGNRQ